MVKKKTGSEVRQSQTYAVVKSVPILVVLPARDLGDIHVLSAHCCAIETLFESFKNAGARDEAATCEAEIT
jgi:hypothetical protein